MYWGFSVGGKMGRKKRTDTKGVVYLISFPNGKYYVGITTTSFEERKRSHISHRNTSNLAVHQALKTFFGQETWKVIAKGDSWEELTKLEVELIEKYQSYIFKNGYNLTLGGGGTVGYEHDDESKQKNSERKTQYFSNEENRIKHSEATKRAYLNNPKQAMQHSDFSKKRFTDENEREKVAEGMRTYLSDEENLRTHCIQRGAKPFFVQTKEGKYIGEWLNQSGCARELNLNKGHINRCLHGKRKSHKGYTFTYKDIE
jgi:group I intron endonuclease